MTQPAQQHAKNRARKPHPHVVPANAQAFIGCHLAEAKAVAAKHNLPASLILAQAALETGWGSRVVGNAYFGIKGVSQAGTSVEFTTHEQDRTGKARVTTASFRAYAGFREAAEDWASLMIRKYPTAVGFRRDGLQMARHLAGYATDVLYVRKLQAVYRTGNLSEYDK